MDGQGGLHLCYRRVTHCCPVTPPRRRARRPRPRWPVPDRAHGRERWPGSRGSPFGMAGYTRGLVFLRGSGSAGMRHVWVGGHEPIKGRQLRSPSIVHLDPNGQSRTGMLRITPPAGYYYPASRAMVAEGAERVSLSLAVGSWRVCHASLRLSDEKPRSTPGNGRGDAPGGYIAVESA